MMELDKLIVVVPEFNIEIAPPFPRTEFELSIVNLSMFKFTFVPIIEIIPPS